MSAPGIPTNFYVQTANAQNLVSWDLSAGATSYIVQRSLDNITFSTIATVSGSPLATLYLDTAVTIGTQYFYQVAASNGTASSYTTAQSVVPVTQGEMCLSQIRLASQQKADRVNSNFVTLPEWNQYINRSMYELYDLLITVYEDYYMETPVQFTADGTTFLYPLPNGHNTFLNGLNPSVTFTPRPFYKLLGVDLALNNATNAYVTVNKFNFIDRNRFVYPNTASTIYGVFNLQYRVVDSNIMFIPTPSGGQGLRLWYAPRLNLLLKDTDVTVTGINGWIEYVITRAAKYALDKEESDTTKLDQEIIFLKGRIEESAANRDAGEPDKISDTRQGGYGSGWGRGPGGTIGGFALAPIGLANYFTNHNLTNTIFHSQGLLGYAAFIICFAYFLYNFRSQFSRRISLAFISNFISVRSSSLISHVFHIIKSRTEEQMSRISTNGIIAFMTNMQNFVKRSFMNFKRYSSSTIFFSFYTKSWSAVNTKIACPTPTIRISSDNNMLHKSIFNAHKMIITELSKLSQGGF